MNILQKSYNRTNQHAITFLLAIALLFSINSCQQPQTSDKIGYASVTGIANQIPEMIATRATLDTLRSELNLPLQQQQQRFQELVAAFQSSEASLTDEMRKYKQQELLLIQDTLNQNIQRSEQLYLQKEQELAEPILSLVQDKLDSISEACGYTYVFNLNAGAPLLLHAPEGDRLDSLVLTSMGIAYESEGPEE